MSSHMLSQTLSAPLMSAQLMASGGRGGPAPTSMATNGLPMTHNMPMMSATGATILSQTLSQPPPQTSSPLLLPTGGSPLQTSLRQPPQPPITFPSMVRPMATVNHSHGLNGNDSLLSDQLMRESSEDSSSQSQQQLIGTNGSIGGAGVAGAGLKNSVLILDKKRLHELVQEVDPSEQLEEEVEDTLLTIADEFIESLVYTSALFAKHRKSTTLDVRDVHLALEKNWQMWIPGFGVDDHQQRQHHKRQAFVTEAHKQRLALIKKTMKKL
ncbi:unnamed protein product [Medioppia subpectinata]|uniref:Transcription initiation factor TFIID subunit 12 n=1 Tax=Medioppia subpectinata TaxID=1979941 RepID=A0A7R9KTW7_9ACAR|nr:unnamed protein product [Medioppia subpectinata]CAG2109431.1 unnamed protein product [Medioppia subpectinata]